MMVFGRVVSVLFKRSGRFPFSYAPNVAFVSYVGLGFRTRSGGIPSGSPLLSDAIEQFMMLPDDK